MTITPKCFLIMRHVTSGEMEYQRLMIDLPEDMKGA